MPADYDRVASDLRENIRTAGTLVLGEGAEQKTWTLVPGAKLPTKLELMRIYGVTGGSIDTAMVLLRAEGYVVGHQGRGRFVAKDLPT